ncbi:MAG TPA: hypothetical protein VH062_06185 [Polyangiaceae bacterium]|nr:hypothetical protein [Polyangiaceae bacterium]
MRQKVTSFLLLLGLVLSSAVVLAAPRDKAAQKKIEEAIYTDFLNTDFDGAEGLLLGTIRACEDKCSPGLVAKAWMYVGVIRGSGRNDISGATEAFNTAIGVDPNVALDNEIATDPVKAAFAKVKAGGSPPPAAASTPAAAAGGSFTCAPAPTEIETRRPFPLQCEADDKVAAVQLHYKSPTGGWQSVKMELHEGSFRGTIPCSATQSTGSMKYYVEGLNADGDAVAQYGSDDATKSIDVSSETTAAPPAYPDDQPPARCAVGEVATEGAAPTGEACGALDGKCGADDCCEEGLTCNEGTCQYESNKKKGKGDYPKNLVGLHFGIDLANVSSSGACTADARSNDNFACFDGNQTFNGTPSLGAPGKIAGGFTLATMRIMASYERLFGAFGLEGRLGFAFNGGKTASGGGTPFLPLHLEARAKWWLRGTSAFSSSGFRPWLHVGGGVAQVDAKVNVGVVDCAPAASSGLLEMCRSANSSQAAQVLHGVPHTLQATKQLGQEFVTVGGGVMYAVAKNHGAVLNLNFMIPFPAVGFVFEPSIGYEYAF